MKHLIHWIAPVLTIGVMAAASLQPGDAIPTVQGKTLDNKQIELPQLMSGRAGVLAFGFSREAGGVIRAWADKLGSEVPVYQIPVLEGVPRLFRGLTESSIRKDSGEKYRGQVVLLYKDEALWRTRLDVASDKVGYLLVVNAQGKVVERISGNPSDAAVEKIRKAIR